MALATRSDVEARLGRPLTNPEWAQAEGLIDEASVLVVGFLGCDPTDPATLQVPPGVAVIVSRMAARALQRAASIEQTNGAEQVTRSAGPFQQSFRFGAGTTAGGPWFTAADRIALRPYRCGGGFASLQATSGRTGRYRTLRPS